MEENKLNIGLYVDGETESDHYLDHLRSVIADTKREVVGSDPTHRELCVDKLQILHIHLYGVDNPDATNNEIIENWKQKAPNIPWIIKAKEKKQTPLTSDSK